MTDDDKFDLTMRSEDEISVGRALGTKPYMLLTIDLMDEDEDTIRLALETGGGIPPGDIEGVAQMFQTAAEILREEIAPAHALKQGNGSERAGGEHA